MTPILSALDYLEEGVILIENNNVTVINKVAKIMTERYINGSDGLLRKLVSITSSLNSDEEHTISQQASSYHVKFHKCESAWCVILKEVPFSI